MSGVTLNTVAAMLVKYTVFILIVYTCVLYPMYTANLFVGYLVFSLLFALLSTVKKEDGNVDS